MGSQTWFGFGHSYYVSCPERLERFRDAPLTGVGFEDSQGNRGGRLRCGEQRRAEGTDGLIGKNGMAARSRANSRLLGLSHAATREPSQLEVTSQTVGHHRLRSE